jgi:tetratricopeptide (TPR) repeat protein
MTTRRPRPVGRILLGLLVAAASVYFGIVLFGCEAGYTPEELADATAQVREAFRLEDFEYGAELGEEWSARAPDAMELNAWTVAHLAQTYRGDPVAYEKARGMAAAYPDSPWSSFAVGAARTWTYPREFAEEALETTERAVAGLPDDVGVALLRAQALEDYEDKESALGFLGSLPEELQKATDVRVKKARLLEPEREERTDSALLSVLEIYQGVLEEDPNHLQAHMGAAHVQRVLGNEEARRQHYGRAAEISPSSWVHDMLWMEIDTDTTLSQEEKTARIAEDVHRVLETHEPSPGRWATMAENLYYVNQWDLQTELEDRVLREYPDSWAVESVMGTRMTVFGYDVIGEPVFDEEKAAEQREKFVDLLERFLARGEFRKLDLLRDAYWDLFLLEKDDPGVDPEYLGDLAQGWASLIEPTSPFISQLYYIHGARILAEYPACLEDAERLIDLARAEMTKQEEEGDRSFVPGRDWPMLSAVRALVLIQEDRLDEAEEELAKASELDPDDFFSARILPMADLYYGRLLERRAELARASGEEGDEREFLRLAEESYLQGLRADYSPDLHRGMPHTNPNEPALEALYERLHGDRKGFADYIAAARDVGSEERRDSVLAQRILDPQPMDPFVLETLEGEVVRSDQFLGQVVIINFWGTW